MLAAQRLVLPVRQEMALDSNSRSPNGFLSALTADDFELVRPHLRSADLVQEFVLVAAGETLKRAYFPHRGVISLVVNLTKGDHVQVAMIGPVADQSATLRSQLVRHGLAVYAQIQQTAGCNASHPVESRLARCLLQTHDLSCGCKLVLTQESMAQMIGARRNSVSLVASTLQQANFIQYSRGHIEITNLDGLTKTACECYGSVKAQYERLLRPRCPTEDLPRGRAGSSSR